MSKVTEFLSRQPAREGKLGAWQAEIIALRQAGASYRTICRFLAEQGMTAKSSEVYRFMQRCGRPSMVNKSVQPPPMPKKLVPQTPDGLPKFE